MKAVVESNAVRGLFPRTASPTTLSCERNGLLSTSCVPMLCVGTLKAILRWHGCSDPFVDLIAEGYAPREFRLGMTELWKVRDTFFMLAKDAINRLNGRISLNVIDLNAIMTDITEDNPSNRLLFPEASSMMWNLRHSVAGSFMWPSFCPSCATPAFWTSCRLFILNSIWRLHPALLAVDFSTGLADFSNEDCARIQKLIADAIQARPALLESTARCDAEITVEAGESALTTEVQRLLVILQDGPKSRQELQEVLEVGRTALLKRFLDPARESGLVMTTEQGSSPYQRYRLVSEDETEGGKQAQPGSKTGLAYPVSTDLVLPQKQAGLPKNGVLSSVAVSVFAGGHAPVRLARYNRWPEAERALILFGRVERFLRSSFKSGTWKELGIVGKLNESDLFRFKNCFFEPEYWGVKGGVVLKNEAVDFNGKQHFYAVGESNLLCLFAQNAGLNLAACSETERAEIGRLAMVIPPAVLYLTNFYAQHFDISRELDKPYHEDKKAMQAVAIEPFNLYRPGIAKIVFHGKDRAPQLQVARIDFADRTLLLPVTFYASAQDPMPCCMMPEVPDSPALYNADAIAANPGATVILTDKIGIPLVNDNDSDFIYCSWYGGMDVIDKVVRELPPDHPYQWLCFDNGDGPAKMYEKAVTVGTIFQKHGRKIAFQVFDGVTWTRNAFGMDAGTYESSRVLSFEELIAEAAKYGVGGRESSTAAPADLRVHSMDELMALKPKDFVLYPLLKEGFYCLIYGGTGVAKTWFALHLAIALSQGTAPFDSWQFNGTPLNVLYVAGEMKPEEYGERLRKLLAEQKTNARFHLVREDLDLAAPEDQERILKVVNEQKSQVVVLDNLSTLASNGHTEGQFEKILALIRKLQATGIIVILVHHENREGGFKGSGKIELVADQSLHLFPAGNGDKIELLVRAEKIRMTSRAEQTAFHTEFDPNQPTEVWPTRSLKKEERRRLDEDDPLGEVEMNVGKKRNDKRLAWQYLSDEERAVAIICDMLSGCHDDVIAANLAVRVIAVIEFRQQFGITEEALKQCMPKAREYAEKKLGKKITPEDLAPEIWKSLKDKGYGSNEDGIDRI